MVFYGKKTRHNMVNNSRFQVEITMINFIYYYYLTVCQ